MANRRSFKSDTSFLEKISMGAIGTASVLKDLKEKAHSPIELERGSTSFKIWKNIKIKRIRVPDVLCLQCGKCVECRTKTKPEISMSHSLADPARGWDRGLDNQDRIAFVVCRKGTESPVDWLPVGPVQYVLTQDLRKSQKAGHAVLTKPKGPEEGFEIRMIWPAATASSNGTVSAVEKDRIQYRRQDDGRTISVRLLKKERPMTPLVRRGDKVLENEVLAYVVPVTGTFPCDKSVDADHYLALLSSPAISSRYMATKALGFFDSSEVKAGLVKRMKDDGEHVYVRLEAAAGLARLGDGQGYGFMEQNLKDEYLQNRLETVIVLGEINRTPSCKLLVEALLDGKQHSDIRAGAAWSLGELRNKAGLKALMSSFEEVDETIRVEAARALAKLAVRCTPEILDEFKEAAPESLPGISWALSKAGQFSLMAMSQLLVSEDTRQWAAYVIGTQNQEKYIREIELLRDKDPEVYFAATVLWKVMTSWIWGLEEY
jgi:hypothetical protein